MGKRWYEDNYRLAGTMLAVAAINGWLAYEFGSKHRIMAFVHAVMAAAMILGVVFFWHLGRNGKSGRKERG